MKPLFLLHANSQSQSTETSASFITEPKAQCTALRGQRVPVKGGQRPHCVGTLPINRNFALKGCFSNDLSRRSRLKRPRLSLEGIQRIPEGIKATSWGSEPLLQERQWCYEHI
ncbi:hypothetical protein QQF64_021440 [Cirrhinus molitorella]|uniref:Uncharacterized protein n=1 Tax=Cirrhinus molitorella TaxID=172907 RepID=A0ABR3LDI4_9TELE